MVVNLPRYNIKMYDITWNNVKTLSPRLIINKPTFTSSINSWPDMIRLDIAKTIDNTDYNWLMFIEITEYTNDNKTGRPLFAGSIEALPWTLDERKNTIGLECRGLHQRLSKIMYQDTWSLVFTKNDTVENILTDILDYANSQQQRLPVDYNGFIWSELWKVGVIDSQTVDIEFDKQTCLEAIISLFEAAWFHFIMTPDGTFRGGVISTTPDHALTLRKDAQSLTIKKRDLNWVINKVYVERKGGNVKDYEDSDSITKYWLREKYISKTDINDETTQDTFGNSYITDNKSPKREIQVKVNSKYDIASIFPWQTIKIRNLFSESSVTDTFEMLDIDWDNLIDIDWDTLYISGSPSVVSENLVENSQVIKTSYDWETMSLYVERYRSLPQLILWNSRWNIKK